jgi:hypothetical protein
MGEARIKGDRLLDDSFLQRLLTAEKLVNDSKSQEAETACLAVLRGSSGLPEGQALLGFILARQRRMAEAEALLREAIVKRPDVPHWHFQLRNILRYDFRLDAWAQPEPAKRNGLRGDRRPSFLNRTETPSPAAVPE